MPLSALYGENITVRPGQMPWYQGPHLFDWLHSVPDGYEKINQDIFFPIQLIRGQDALGTLRSGVLLPGTKLKLNGSEEVQVQKLNAWPHELDKAHAGMPLRLTLDKTLKRGDILTGPEYHLLQGKTWVFECCYLQDENMPLNQSLLLRYQTLELKVTSLMINREFDLDEQKWINTSLNEMERNKVYGGVITLNEILFAEEDGNIALFDAESGQTLAAGKLRMIGSEN